MNTSWSSAFADDLGVELKNQTADNLDDLFDQPEQTNGPAAGRRVGQSDGRQQVRTLLPCPLEVTPADHLSTANGSPPRRPGGQKILVLKGSSHAEQLAALKLQLPGRLTYEESAAVEVVDLLRMVDEGQST